MLGNLSRRTMVVATLLLLAAGAATLAVLGAHNRNPDVARRRYLERGTQYYEQKRYSEAIIELRNALRIDPKFLPALIELGKAYGAKSWGPDAVRELERALELKPDSAETVATLAQLDVKLEVWEDALKYGELLRLMDPGNPWGAYAMGAALNGQGRPEEAMRVLEPLVATDPPRPEFLRVYGDTLRSLRRPPEAEQAYRRSLELDPKYGDALVALGSLLIAQNRADEGRATLMKARALDPDNPRTRLAVGSLLASARKLDEAIAELEAVPPPARSPNFLLALADAYMRAGRNDAAVEILAPLARLFPAVFEAHFMLGHALLGARQPDRAVAAFREAERVAPDNPQVHYGLALAHQRGGRPEEALKELHAVGRSMETSPDYHLALSVTLVALGRFDDATRQAETARTLAPRSAATYGLLGDIAAARQDVKRAREMFTRAAEVEPRSPGGFLALGHLERQPEQALKAYDEALQRDPRYFPSILAKAQTLLRLRRDDEALRFVEACAAADPQDARVSTLLGSLYAARGDAGHARGAFEQAIKADERSPTARLGLARLAVLEKKDAEAVALLSGALKDDPGNGDAAITLAGIHAGQGRYDQAVAVLEGATRAKAGSIELQLTLAEAYIKGGRYDDALSRLQPLLDKDPKLARARVAAGLAQLGKLNAAEAVRQFEAADRLDPRNASTLSSLGRARVLAGDVDGGRRALEESLQADPTNKQVEIELAVLSRRPLAGGAGARRIEELRAAIGRNPSDLVAHYALALAYTTENRTKDAEEEYERILVLVPAFVPANLALGLQRFGEGKPLEGVQYLKAVLRASPNDIRANDILARFYETQGNRELAIPHLQAIVRVNPRAEHARLRLAVLYAAVARFDDALPHARQAAVEEPTSPAAHELLGRLLLQKGDWPGAIEAFGKVIALAPRDAGAYLGLGNAHERRGEVARAEAAYRKVAEIAPRNPLAYNNLAWLYATTGGDLREALTLAERARALAPDVPTFLETLGVIHYKREEFARAAPLLQRAAESMRDSPALQYHLGMTMYRLGQNREAVQALRRALDLDDKLAEAPQVRRILRELGG